MRRWRLVAQIALGGAVLAAFPSAGSAYVAQFPIALTPNGPSPSVVTLGAGARSPLWINQDQVTHAVVFANGLCSLQVAAGESGSYSDDFFARVGQYPYTVDGTVQASVAVVLNPRTVTLTASSHIISRGAPLTLHGELAASVPVPAPSLQPVTVLARHDRNHAFHRIAVVRTKYGHGLKRSVWHLRVRPGMHTTYIAEAKYQPDSHPYWRNATSKPFNVAVRVRH
jgi:hypothetical protein